MYARIRVYCDRFTAVSGRVAPGDVGGCRPVHGRPPTAILFMVSIPAYGCLFVAERCAYTGVPLDTQWPYHASLKRLTKPPCDVVVKATIFFQRSLVVRPGLPFRDVFAKKCLLGIAVSTFLLRAGCPSDYQTNRSRQGTSACHKR